jgi:hypothetical protein
MNFLHFAILLFAISVVLLVAVSLATAPVSVAQLRGLTFKTLESSFIHGSARSQRLFRLQLAGTIVLALFVIGLWVHFA